MGNTGSPLKRRRLSSPEEYNETAMNITTCTKENNVVDNPQIIVTKIANARTDPKLSTHGCLLNESKTALSKETSTENDTVKVRKLTINDYFPKRNFTPVNPNSLSTNNPTLVTKHTPISVNKIITPSSPNTALDEKITNSHFLLAENTAIGEDKTLLGKVTVINDNKRLSQSLLVEEDTVIDKNNDLRSLLVESTAISDAINISPSLLEEDTATDNKKTTSPSLLAEGMDDDNRRLLQSLATMADDMFVLEAPSFTIPYIYEKPPAESLRTIVDKLAIELKEMNIEKELKAAEIRNEMKVDVVAESPTIPKQNSVKKENENIGYMELLNAELNLTNDAINNIVGNCAIERFFVELGLNLVTNLIQNEIEAVEEFSNRKIKKIVSQQKCKECDFSSESKLVMSHHENRCKKLKKFKPIFCSIDVNGAIQYNEIIIEQNYFEKTSRYWCTYCATENRSKQGINKHVLKCFDKFNLELNLASSPDLELPAKVTKNKSFNSVAGLGGKKNKKKSNIVKRCSVSLNNSNLLNNVIPVNEPKSQETSIIKCEICDGYIKNSIFYQTHMKIIHNILFTVKTLTNIPHLKCQRCEKRFFTCKGLERHLLGMHGLVTAMLQNDANSGVDSGKCLLCGALEGRILKHMVQVHFMTLSPIHLSYRCTICNSVFYNYDVFESHVYAIHASKQFQRPCLKKKN